MTKSGKHKKEFRKEKNKIKLKLAAKSLKPKSKKTEFLPKGLNVTDTSFRSKKIVIPNTLGPDESSGIPLTSRKQTFKELISRMNHFSATIQLDGINGMKELISKNPEILEVNLSTLFNKIPDLVAARDFNVRKASLKLLEIIIQSITPEKISPFFPLLNAQLMCSMNHIQLDIQKDSHLLLDLLLTNIPQLVSNVALEILPNFLEQISCRDDGGKRVLAMNPNQRLTSLKWRKEVLTRVHRLLYLLLEKNKPKENSINVVSNIELNHQQAPLYTKRDFNLKLNLQKPGHSNAIVGTSSNLLQEFIAHLFPLLIETWVEAMAGEQLNKGQGGSLISAGSAELLICMTNIMYTVWCILNQCENNTEQLNWFQNEHGDALIRNFIQRFPFSARVEQKKKNVKLDSLCREQNLILCFMWTQINLKSSPRFAKSIFQYLCGLFQTADHQLLTSIEIDQLRNILMTSCTKRNYNSHVNNIVEAAVEFSNRVKADRKDRLMLNRTLLEVGLSISETENIPELKKWIESCPSLLQEASNIALLASINRVMNRNATSLMNGKKEVGKLLERSTHYSNKFAYWKPIFDFLYWTCRDSTDIKDILLAIRNIIDRLEDKDIQCYGSSVLHAIEEHENRVKCS